ncbi:MAG: hypothetical protein WC966_11055 [Bradymonadales bacterium]
MRTSRNYFVLLALIALNLALSSCFSKNEPKNDKVQELEKLLENPEANVIRSAASKVKLSLNAATSLSTEELLTTLQRLAEKQEHDLSLIYEDAINMAKIPQIYQAYAEYLQQNSDFTKARIILDQGLIQNPNNPLLTKSYHDNLRKDPDLNAPPRQLIPQEDLTSLKLLGGGSTLVFRVIKDSETIAALKPQQTRLQSNYRSEIAAYRLCPLIHCQYDIPRNFHVYIDYNHFVSLYRRIKSNPMGELKDLSYLRNNEDGKDYVHATYKDWVKSYTVFPIEFSSIWKPWLNTTEKETLKTTAASTIIDSFAKKHPLGKKLRPQWEEHLQGLELYNLSLQISNLIVFDFLSNNWDRFSGVPNFWGINCQISNGKFVSIDNGASFPRTPNPKPLKNLRDISRFSRLTIDSIKNLEFEDTLEFLFPKSSPFERERFQTFWNQRDELIKYVDECIEKNGEEATYFFE